MPSLGNGPQPMIDAGDKATWKASPIMMAEAGTTMVPAPRETLAMMFISQTKTLPLNTSAP
jgi:hypothetical protein